MLWKNIKIILNKSVLYSNKIKDIEQDLHRELNSCLDISNDLSLLEKKKNNFLYKKKKVNIKELYEWYIERYRREYTVPV